MGRKSQRKGASGELELRNLLERITPDLEAKRTGHAQAGQKDNLPDVLHPLFSPESKRYKKVSIGVVQEGLRQAQATAQEGQFPFVYHRSDREDGLVTLRAEDFVRLAREWYQSVHK